MRACRDKELSLTLCDPAKGNSSELGFAIAKSCIIPVSFSDLRARTRIIVNRISERSGEDEECNDEEFLHCRCAEKSGISCIPETMFLRTLGTDVVFTFLIVMVYCIADYC